MAEYEIQYETLFKRKDGWYVFRDLEGNGFGEYLFACHQYSTDSPKTYSQWVDPVPTPPTPATKYFSTREKAIKAMARAIK